MSAVVCDVPDEAVSVIHKNKHLLLRYDKANEISNALIPFTLDDFFELNYDNDNYDDRRGNISAEFSVDDDGSVSVDSFHSAHESDFSIDYNGGHITCENKTNDEYSDVHNVQSSILSYPKKVFIRGMAGIGKSTLAATVSCRQDVREAFDYIFWIDVGERMRHGNNDEEKIRNDLNYDKYRDCLRIMFKQLMAKNRFCKSDIAESCENDKKYDKFRQRFAEEVVCSSGEITSIQAAAKQVEAMLAARSEMAQILSGFTILIILDDVWCIEDIDFFNFCCSSSSGPDFLSILVTTRTAVDETQLPQTITLSLELLNEAEGAKLLGWEMGLMENFDFEQFDLPDKILFTEILKKCGYLPLAIRMLGRSMKLFFNSASEYSLDSVLSHAMMALDDTDLRTNHELEASSENISMFITLDRTFSLVIPTIKSSDFLKFCFGALAVAFTRPGILRPWISLDIVLLLWKSFLESQTEEVGQALRKDGLLRSNDVCKILETIGAIDTMYNVHCNGKNYVRIGHDLLWEFGRKYFEINLPAELTVCNDRFSFFQKWSKFLKPTGSIIDVSTSITQFFNKKIVTLYEEMTNGFYSYHINDGHIFAFYPTHMIQSNFLTKAFNLLNNQNFICTRLQVLGMEEGIQRHMQDIELLLEKSSNTKKQDILKSNKNIAMELVNTVIFVLVSFSSTYNESGTDIHSIKLMNCLKARGLVIVGAGAKKFHLWHISLTCFSKALQYLRLVEFPSSHPDVQRIMRYMDATNLYPLQLVLKNSPHQIVLKHAASLREGNLSTGLPLVLSSHPGHAIVPIKNNFDYLPFFGNFCTLGIGSEEGAMKVSYDDRSITRIKDGAVMHVHSQWLHEGSELNIKPFPKSYREKSQQVMRSVRGFVINENGTVSTSSRPDLVLGLGYYPRLYLVDRFSMNCAIFKNAHVLLQSKKSSYADNDTGIPLELTSHPTYAIAPISSVIPLKFGICQMKLGLGPKEKALQVVYVKNKLFVSGSNNLYLCSPYGGGNIIIAGSKIPYNSQSLLSKLLRYFLLDNMSNFSVNDDGTISPLNAPHLALGFQQPHLAFGFQQQPIRNETHEHISGYAYDPLQSGRNVKNCLWDMAVYLFVFFFF